jgi:hypothetical protein
VYAGRQVVGGGTTNDSPMGGFGALASVGTKQDTTGADGAFALAGFGDGDLAIVADHPAIGRSKPLRVGDDNPNQTQLVLELQKYGALSGVLRQGGQPQGSVAVTVQSTTTPGALYVVTTGPDGAYRFDRLAPDTYKVSATVGSMRMGLRFYSKQIDVPPGKEVTVDLAVDPGPVTVEAEAQAAGGKVGIVVAYLISTSITATTANQLQLALAAAGPGTSQLAIGRGSTPATFTNVTPGAYTACAVPLPLEVKGIGAIGYVDRHAGKLGAFCKAVDVLASPDTQATQIPVQIPPFIPDNPPTTGGGGRGGGGTGGAGTTPTR